MEKLGVTIIPEDFRNAPRGYRNGDLVAGEGCVLWQALKRKFPDRKIHVGFSHVVIGESTYRIDNSVWGKSSSPEAEFPVSRIMELSDKAKQSLEGIPTVSLTLTLE